MSPKGTVFDIQKFSLNDGPGIRTTVFLKGCPLNCLWCHNPESKEKEPELFYNAERCLHCGRCVSKCPQGCHRMNTGRHSLDRPLCTRCGHCTETACPALSMAGKTVDAETVIAEVLKDRVFYEASGGGLTLSGGEPLFQAEFAAGILGLAKARTIHTCVETSGFAGAGFLETLVPLTDIFLFDFKEQDPVRHKAYTGVDKDLILRNLRALDELDAKIILRCPIIPGINDRPDHFKGIAGIAEKLNNIREVHVEPYHPLGESKSRNLGKTWGLPGRGFPPEETVAGWIAAIQADTAVPVKKA